MTTKNLKGGKLDQPRLRLVAGPNGSGKSTFTADILQEHVSLGVYVNPDEIAKTLEGEDYFIGVEHSDINKERVKNREKLGGHGFNACLLVNRAYIFDNSLNDYYMVAEVHETELIVNHDNLAAQLSWHRIHLLNKLKDSRSDRFPIRSHEAKIS